MTDSEALKQFISLMAATPPEGFPSVEEFLEGMKKNIEAWDALPKEDQQRLIDGGPKGPPTPITFDGSSFQFGDQE